MKETIYTIPLTEALENTNECIFCHLEDKMEQEQIAYALGPAMMEPDYRILSNEKGFCRRHTHKLSKAQKALPFALVLDTRMDEVLRVLKQNKPTATKSGFFSGKKTKTEELTRAVCSLTKTCLVCERIDATMEKFFKTFWYLFDKETDFQQRILDGNGFCLHHFGTLLSSAGDYLSGAKRERYTGALYDTQMRALEQTKKEIHGFVKQFDYRSNEEDRKGPKNAHLLCAARLSRSFERD